MCLKHVVEEETVDDTALIKFGFVRLDFRLYNSYLKHVKYMCHLGVARM